MTTNTKPLTRWRLLHEGSRWRWRIEWKRADQWLGRFYDGPDQWICVVPCLPIHWRLWPAWPKDGLPDTPEFDQLLEEAPELALWASVCESRTVWYICQVETGAIVGTAYSLDNAKTLFNLKVHGPVNARLGCVHNLTLTDQPTDEPGGDDE